MKRFSTLFLLAVLLTLSLLAAEPAPTSYLYFDQPTSYQDFDQSRGKGWRALSDQKRFAEAARMIEGFLAKQPQLTVREKAKLHFHAAQRLVETSTDLTDWTVAATRVAGAQTWTLSSPFVALTPNAVTGQVTVTFNDAAPRRFFRLKAIATP